MKLFKLLAIAFLLFTANSAMAQYGYGSPYYGTGSSPGMDRSIDTQRNKGKTKNKKALEEQKKERELDVVVVMTDYLTKELKLDDFQKAAVKGIYTESKDELIALNSDDAPLQVIKDKAQIISEKIDAKIMPLLSKEQAAKYQIMIDKRTK